MKQSFFSTSLFSAFLLLSGSRAEYVCPTAPSMSDMSALQYAYTIQELLNQYYQSVPVNASFFSGLPMADQVASNGATLAENTVTNVEGLAQQAKLGSQALQMEISSTGTSMPQTCQYMLPTASNASQHLMNAFQVEATLCGAFIGLADYFQIPTLNSLSARLAAEHGIHASAIRAMTQAVGFMPNSSMLTPAFTPDEILMSGTEVGMLGNFLNGCAMSPPAPCGGMVSFGDLLSSLSGQSGSSNNNTGSGSGSPTSTQMPSGAAGTNLPTYTGGASISLSNDIGIVGGVLLAMVSYLM